MAEQRRIVARTLIRRVDGLFIVRAFDQGGKRYPEADLKDITDRDEASRLATDMVNRSHSAEQPA